MKANLIQQEPYKSILKCEINDMLINLIYISTKTAYQREQTTCLLVKVSFIKRMSSLTFFFGFFLFS